MPKKTRQEKIVAQLKRLQKQQASQPEKPVNEVTQSPTISVVSPTLESLRPNLSVELSPNKETLINYSYAVADLRKTLVFVVVAIIFEFILSRLI